MSEAVEFEKIMVARRMIELDVSLLDFISMFADNREVDVHAGMLGGLLQTIRSWERDGFDWPKHVDQVVGQLFPGDLTTMKVLRDALYQSHDHSLACENESQVQDLKIALADAIRRPMGVVPKSAEGLVSDADLDAAEKRRPGI